MVDVSVITATIPKLHYLMVRTNRSSTMDPEAIKTDRGMSLLALFSLAVFTPCRHFFLCSLAYVNRAGLCRPLRTSARVEDARV